MQGTGEKCSKAINTGLMKTEMKGHDISRQLYKCQYSAGKIITTRSHSASQQIRLQACLLPLSFPVSSPVVETLFARCLYPKPGV